MGFVAFLVYSTGKMGPRLWSNWTNMENHLHHQEPKEQEKGIRVEQTTIPN
jgi:hypothetical protein